MLFRHGHALLIGVSSYEKLSAGWQVPATAGDANALASVLRDPSLAAYPREQVRVCHAESADKAGLLDALDHFAATTAEDDTFLFFYSGHGHYAADGTFYLTTSDTELEQAGGRFYARSGSGISQAELLEKLKTIQARRVLLAINACHSGELMPTLGGEEPAALGAALPDQTAKALLGTGAGRVVISACRPEQYSFIGTGDTTIFGQALIDAFAGVGVPSRGGYISAFDLYSCAYETVVEAVRARVPEDVRRRYGGTQEPVLSIIRQVGPFPVALHRGKQGKDFDAPPQPRANAAVEEVAEADAQALFRRLVQVRGTANLVDASSGSVGGHKIFAAPNSTVIVHSPPSPQPSARQHAGVPPKPLRLVERPDEQERIVGLLTGTEHVQQLALIAALRGAGGHGKTTLAIAVCHDPRVRAAFPNGILWVTVEQHPPSLIASVVDIVERLAGQRPNVPTIDQAGSALDAALGQRRCLLVIDDVWEAAHLQPFLQGGPRCVRLITTRNSDTLPARTECVTVGPLDDQEAFELLAKDLVVVDALRPRIERLARRLGGWALCVALINALLVELYKDGFTVSAALARVEARAARYDFDLDTSKVIATSLAFLPAPIRQRHAELAIFPNDQDIPFAAIAALWEATARFEPGDVEEICERLERCSLITNYNRQARTLRLHYEMYLYLTHNHRAALPRWHAAFLEQRKPESGWAAAVEDEYLGQFLAHHLEGAGQGDELVATVKDGRYLARKAALRGGLAVEEDLRRALRLRPDDEQLRLAEQQMRWCGDILHHCKGETEYIPTLLSWFSLVPALGSLAETLRGRLTPPYLLPLHQHQPDTGLLRIFSGHTWVVSSAVFSPDGRTVLSASGDGALKLWEVASGRELRSFKGHTNWVSSAVFSPDGSTVLSASWDDTLKLWDVASGRELRSFQGHTDLVSSAVFSPDGRTALSASRDDTLKLWEVASGRELRSFQGHTSGVSNAVFSPGGRTVLSASEDGTLKLWEVASGRELRSFQGHTSGVKSAVFSPDGSTALSASDDRTLKLWEVASGRELRSFQGHTRVVSNAAFSPDGKTVLSASHDGTLRLWGMDAPAQRERPASLGDAWLALRSGRWSRFVVKESLRSHSDEYVINACVFSADGVYAVFVTSSGVLRLWDVTGWRPLAMFRTDEALLCCAIAPDNRTIVAGGRRGWLYWLRVVWEG